MVRSTPGVSSGFKLPPSLSWLPIALVAAALAACVTVTREPRAVMLEHNGQIRVQRLTCPEGVVQARASPQNGAGLDPAHIRLLTWNIHKEGDAGWQADLKRFAAQTDLLLLQEIVLNDEVRDVIEQAGLQWAMASSFIHSEIDIGVLTAARIAPLATCTERVVEPLLRIPKSAVVTWYALKGSRERLAVINMHSINFSLSLGAYRAQLAAVRDALATHDGPMIFAGDLNTWTAGRDAAVRETAVALGLTEVSFDEDRRKLFFGKQLDHIFTRGLLLSSSMAIPVLSSDHNPVQATLRTLP